MEMGGREGVRTKREDGREGKTEIEERKRLYGCREGRGEREGGSIWRN